MKLIFLLAFLAAMADGFLTPPQGSGCRVCPYNPCIVTLCLEGSKCIPNKCKCRGICSRGTTCQKPCLKIYRPVCGTNGVTYNNQCLLENAICKSGGKIQKKKDGRCVCRDACPLMLCSAGSVCKFDPKRCTSTCVGANILPACPPPPPEHVFCLDAITTFCTPDCRTCCIGRSTCAPGGPILFTRTKFSCDNEER